MTNDTWNFRWIQLRTATVENEKIGSLEHTLFIQGCQGSCICLSIVHWVLGILYIACHQQAAEFLQMNDDILWLPIRGLNPPTSAHSTIRKFSWYVFHHDSALKLQRNRRYTMQNVVSGVKTRLIVAFLCPFSCWPTMHVWTRVKCDRHLLDRFREALLWILKRSQIFVSL